MFDSYIVKKGDTLYSVANKCGVSISELERLNDVLFNSELRENMELIVPKDNKKYFDYYVIEKGDTLYGISKKYNINPNLLATINGLDLDDYIYPNEELIIPKSGYSYYITSNNDTLESVIKVFNSNSDKLLKENSNIYLLPGQLFVNKK